ncbi:MAG: membrane protein of unknown function [Promethearchaeota archaeon]|nr:MAG: membrane protein of unknown function [Candidatus Lokiarchaeota archaeon]
MIIEILKMIFHVIGFLIMCLMVYISIKFMLSYKKVHSPILLGGIAFALTFLAALFYFTLRFFFGLFGIDISLDYRTALFVIYGVDFMVVVSWFYITYQLMYSQNKFVKQMFYIFLALNILWELFFFYMIFFSEILIETAELIVFIYDLFALLLTMVFILFLAIKSLKSNDDVLKTRGFSLLMGLILCVISLIIEDGVFTPEWAFLDTIMRILLLLGVFLLFQGFFIGEESKIFKIYNSIKMKKKED